MEDSNIRPLQTTPSTATPYGSEKCATMAPYADPLVYGPWKKEGWNKLGGDADEAGRNKKRGPLLFLFRMYGKTTEDTEALEDTPSQPITHPVGWKRFLILLSGAIPYVVVGPFFEKEYRRKRSYLIGFMVQNRWSLTILLLVRAWRNFGLLH